MSVTLQPGRQPGEQRRQPEQDAPRQRLVDRTAQEPAAEREVGAVRVQRGDQPRDIRGPVLAVGIERHDDVGAVPQRQGDAGLQRGALPEIDRMTDDRRAGSGRGIAGPVARTVVDHDDVDNRRG